MLMFDLRRVRLWTLRPLQSRSKRSVQTIKQKKGLGTASVFSLLAISASNKSLASHVVAFFLTCRWSCLSPVDASSAWIVPKDISKLQQHEIEAFIREPYKRSGDLLKGYRIAADPTKWEEEIEAKRAEAAEEEANAEIDQLQSDEEDGDDSEEKSTKTKKRKRESDAASVKSKPKVKAKKGSDEPASKKSAKSTPKAKKNGAKPRTSMVESEDEGGMGGDDEDAGPSKQASPPPAKKAKHDKDEDEADGELHAPIHICALCTVIPHFPEN